MQGSQLKFLEKSPPSVNLISYRVCGCCSFQNRYVLLSVWIHALSAAADFLPPPDPVLVLGGGVLSDFGGHRERCGKVFGHAQVAVRAFCSSAGADPGAVSSQPQTSRMGSLRILLASILLSTLCLHEYTNLSFHIFDELYA